MDHCFLLPPAMVLLLPPSRNTFAYATSDNVVYLRQFGLASGDMVLLGSLQGHHSEVTQVRDYPPELPYLYTKLSIALRNSVYIELLPDVLW